MRVAAVAVVAVVAAAAATFVLTRESAAPPAARPSPTPEPLATGSPSPAAPAGNLSQRLRGEAGIEAVEIHLAAFAAIAADNGGTRAAGTPGFGASADYVAERLQEAGYEVGRQRFSFPSYRIHSPPRLRRDGRAVPVSEFKVMLFSPGGSAEATAVRVGESDPRFAGC
ncbi:MAG TPA: hypothetical protein VM573_09335, partial [Actinomycetota bacterium]|nr:hypothetical protein [Actinomycetota bacterium]